MREAMQHQDEGYTNIKSALEKLRNGDLSGFSVFQNILDQVNGDGILKLALSSCSIVKSDLDIIKACFMADRGTTIDGTLLDTKGYSFLNHIKPSVTEAANDSNLDLFILAKCFSDVLCESTEESETLLEENADMDVVKDFYNKHIFQKEFNATIQFEDWKILVEKLLKLKRYLELGDKYSRSEEQIAKIDTCLARMGMLDYAIIRMADTNAESLAEVVKEATKLNQSLTEQIGGIEGEDVTTTKIKRIAQEAIELSLTDSNVTEVLSLQKRLKKELKQLNDNKISKIHRKATFVPQSKEDPQTAPNQFFNLARAIKLIDEQLLDIYKSSAENNATRITELKNDREKFIREGVACFENFNTLLDEYLTASNLFSLLSRAQDKIDLFKGKSDPTFYTMYNFKDSITQKFVVIYANEKLYKVTKKAVPGEDSTYHVEEIHEIDSNKYYLGVLRDSLNKMRPGIRGANLEETFALTDVIPSTSEVLRTRNIFSVIVDFVHQFKLFLINTFLPELSFQTLEVQCQNVLSNSKFVPPEHIEDNVLSNSKFVPPEHIEDSDVNHDDEEEHKSPYGIK